MSEFYLRLEISDIQVEIEHRAKKICIILPLGISNRDLKERAEEGIPICSIHRITHELVA